MIVFHKLDCLAIIGVIAFVVINVKILISLMKINHIGL